MRWYKSELDPSMGDVIITSHPKIQSLRLRFTAAAKSSAQMTGACPCAPTDVRRETTGSRSGALQLCPTAVHRQDDQRISKASSSWSKTIKNHQTHVWIWLWSHLNSLILAENHLNHDFSLWNSCSSRKKTSLNSYTFPHWWRNPNFCGLNQDFHGFSAGGIRNPHLSRPSPLASARRRPFLHVSIEVPKSQNKLGVHMEQNEGKPCFFHGFYMILYGLLMIFKTCMNL